MTTTEGVAHDQDPEQPGGPRPGRDLPEASAAPGPRTPGRWAGLAERFGLLALFVALMVVFSLTTTNFFTLSNLRVVLGSQGDLAILAIAALAPLVAGQFDLSVGANMGTCAIVVATMMSRYHAPLAVAVIVTLAFGVAVGAVNGLFVARLGVNSFIVTLAMATVLQGLVQWYTGGSTILTGISQHLVNAATGNMWGIPRGLLWLVPVAVIAWYGLEHTPYGRYLASLGSNPSAARLVGLPVRRLVLSTFLLSGGLSALAGILLVAQAGDADPQGALGALLLPALAAAFLGASAFRPGRFNVAGTMLAVYFVAFSVSGLEFWGAASWIEQLFDGVALAGAVTVSTLLGRRRRPAS
jgi:ribose transport system permease protein